MTCKFKMHAACIKRYAAKPHIKDHDTEYPGMETTAEDAINVQFRSSAASATSKSTIKLAMTDTRPVQVRQWEEDALCLSCGRVLLSRFSVRE